MPPSSSLTRPTRTVAIVAAGTAILLLTNIAGADPADGQATPGAVPYEDLYGPTGAPDRVLLTPTTEPATSQAVSWRTTVDVETPVLEIAESEPGPGFKNYEGRSGRNEVRVVPGQTTGVVDETLHYPMRFHTAVVDGLAPDTAYLYRVGDGSNHRANWSEWFEFSTATAGASDFSFIYVGDAQNDTKEHVSRVFRRAYQDRPDASLFLHAGDLTDVADRDFEWGEWFHAHALRTGNVNQIATPGNHEYFRENPQPNDTLAAYWDTQFNYPDNGPQAPADATAEEQEVYDLLGRGSVYHLDYQGVRFISLDSNGSQAFPAGAQRDLWWQIQADWLDEVLTDNTSAWTVVFHHHPVFSVSVGRDNADLRNAWLPVILEHEVDLVLAGHDHTYGRGHVSDAPPPPPGRPQPPARGNTTVEGGTVFAVSVSGPKMYDVSGQVWGDNGADLRATAQDTQLYQLIDVSSRELRYEARDATGGLEDGLRITVGPRGERRIVPLDAPGR